ncbi:reverse transcriptase domain-containing protein [Tanacetum coccineum]
MDEDELIPIILGRPFLATARAVIDVHEGRLSLRAKNETVTFNNRKSTKSKYSRDDYLYCADHMAKLIREQWVDTIDHEGEWIEAEEGRDLDKVRAVSFYPSAEPVKPLEWKALENQLKPLSVEPPKVELKELPEHLKYAFLLCEAPITFQRYMTAIFQELIKDSMEIFMDDFSVFEDGIVLGHKVFGSGIEVDKAKFEAISKLPYPTNVKAIRSFLGHVGFYRRFIKYFSQVARPMTQLLVKDASFNFFEECIQAFDKLKHELTQAPIMIKPDWSLPFEIMCDASDYAVGAVLGQRIDKHFQPIHYASKTMNEAQENYTTIENELLAVRDNKGVENLAVDHLSQLENPDLGRLTKAEIRDIFPEERLMTISDKNNKPWMTHSCSNNVQTKSYKGTKDEAAQILRQYHSGPSGGHHDWSELAMPVNDPATSPQGVKHLKSISKYAKYSMSGE